jgi:hypothetical protein
MVYDLQDACERKQSSDEAALDKYSCW